MSLTSKIFLLFAGFLVSSRGEQQCSEIRTWPLYLNGIHCLLSSYYFQQQPLKFNVENYKAWGNGGKKGIHLTEENYGLFLIIMREYNLCLDQTKLNQTQITVLDKLLKEILGGHVKIEKLCKDRTVRITGTLLRIGDLNFTDYLSWCSSKIERIEVFAADTVYFNENFRHGSNFHLSIAAPRWILGKATGEIALPQGSFLGIYEDFLYPNQLSVETKNGKIISSRQQNLFFYELAKTNLSRQDAKEAAENCAKTVQNFQIFMKTIRNNVVLRERITPFLEGLDAHLKPTFLDELTFLSYSYEFYKNAKLLSLNFPIGGIGSDRKIQKLLFAKMLTHVFVFEDNSYNNREVDLDALLDLIINNLESVEYAYSAPLLNRFTYSEEDNRGKKIELSIVESHRKQFEIHLRHIIECNLDFLKAWSAEINEEIENLKNTKDESKNPVGSLQNERTSRESFLYYVIEVADLLSSIPLLASLPNFVGKGNEFKLRCSRLKNLTDDKRSSCEEVNRQTGKVKGLDDFCKDFRRIGKMKFDISFSSVSHYSQVGAAFKVSDVEGLLLRVLKFVLKYCKKFGDLNVIVRRTKIAIEGAFDILDLISKHGNILKLEMHNREAMSFEYADRESLWQLAHSDTDDIDREIKSEIERRKQDIEIFKAYWTTSIFNINRKFEKCFYFVKEMSITLKYTFEHERNIWNRHLTIAEFLYALSVVPKTDYLSEFKATVKKLLKSQMDILIAPLTEAFPSGFSMAFYQDFFDGWENKINTLKRRTSRKAEKWNSTNIDFAEVHKKVFPAMKKWLENAQNCTKNIFAITDIKDRARYERLIKNKSIAAGECIGQLLSSYNSTLYATIGSYDTKFNFEIPKFHHEFFKLHYKLDSLLSNLASELVKFRKGIQNLLLNKLPTYKDKALNRIKMLKTIDSFTKLYTAPFEYNRLINAIKQYTFPLAHVYLTHHDLPKVIDVNKAPINILEKIKKFKYDLRDTDQMLKFEELKHISLFGFNNFTPFFTWKNSQSIRSLLRGKEVVLIADLNMSNVNLTAVKFNTIGLNFSAAPGLGLPDKYFREESQKWLVEMTHQGDSLYNCDGKEYIIRTPAQKFRFSLALKEGTTEPLVTNYVYDEIKNGGYVLSPYATWKVRIFKGLNSSIIDGFLEHQFNFTVELVGRGQYYEESSQMCLSENLNEYYESVGEKYEYFEMVDYFKNPIKCSTSSSPTIIGKADAESKEDVEEISY